MSKSKKNIIATWCLLIVLICIYTPWKSDTQTLKTSRGYSFIWKPLEFLGFNGIIDIERMIFEIIGVTALCGIGFLFCEIFKQKDPNK